MTQYPASEQKSLSPYAGTSGRPVFVGACPRSGTTLLRTMLNSHPELAMPRETRFVPHVWQQRAEFGDLSDRRNRRRLARWIFKRKKTQAGRLEVDPDEAIKRLVAAPPTLGSLVGTCFLLYAEQHGKPRWGDKRPMYAQYLDALFAMFPDAQFINVVRDPRASVASMRKLNWFQGDVVHATELWERSLRAARAGKRRLAADQFLEMRYEDLVGDPERSLQQVTSFLGLAPDGIGEMLSYYEKVDEVSARYHWRLSQPVTSATVDSWTETLRADEVALIEHATGAEMRRRGYEPRSSAEVPAELRRALRGRRREKARERLGQWGRENRLRLTYRYPVASRLADRRPGG